MAWLGDVPPANRYQGLGVGPRLVYTFETQEGIPVDGTNELLRDLSPFNFRILPPATLLQMASEDGATQASGVNLITAAVRGYDLTDTSNQQANALARVSAVGDLSAARIAQLEAFVAGGEFVQNQQAGFLSTLADAFTAADISLQLSRILSMPPLTLMINPREMTVNYNKIQSYQQRTRYGYSFEAWGEEQPTISFSGSTGAFIAGATDVSNPFGGQVTGQTSSVSGMQAAARRDSAAWQNFISLYHFYRNNGYIYDTMGKSEAHLFVGALAIDYDQWTYVGQIDSFSYSHDAESPHRVEFELEFHVSKMYDRASSSVVVLPQNSPTLSLDAFMPTRGSRSPSTLDVFGVGRARRPTGGEGEGPSEMGDVPFDLLGGF